MTAAMWCVCGHKKGEHFLVDRQLKGPCKFCRTGVCAKFELKDAT